MEQNQIESLDSRSFANKKLSHLEEIWLNSNKLTHVNEASFGGVWPKLTILDLSGNEIAFVDANAFQHLANLIELNLSHNRLCVLQATLCHGLSKLKKLNVSSNRLAGVDLLGTKSSPFFITVSSSLLSLFKK